MKAALIIVTVLFVVTVAGVVVLEMIASSRLDTSKRPLAVAASWDVKPALEQIAQRYEAQTGRRVDVRYGTSAELLAELQLSKQGDVYICSSARERGKAVEAGVVTQWEKRPLAYLVPAIIVQRNSPVTVQYLSDLFEGGLSLVIADPEQEAMGRYAIELLEAAGLGKAAREVVQEMAASAPAAVELVSLGKVDAAIAWRAMQQWEPAFLSVVEIPEDVARVALVSVGTTAFCRDVEAVGDFIEFLDESEAQSILQKWHYTTRHADALKAAPDATLGGEPELPARWRAVTQQERAGAEE
jgi:molybdate transport system substrate-binding protein